MCDRAILAAGNIRNYVINDKLVAKLSGDSASYLAIDIVMN